MKITLPKKFQILVQGLWLDFTAIDYINFDTNIPASKPLINEYKIDW